MLASTRSFVTPKSIRRDSMTAYRGSLASDPEVRAIVEEGRQRQAARILETVASDAEPAPLLRLAVHGWIACAQNIIARWLQERDATREAVCELLCGALSGAIEAAIEADRKHLLSPAV